MKTKSKEDLMLRMYLNLSVTTNILFMLMKLILIYTAEVEGVHDVNKELVKVPNSKGPNLHIVACISSTGLEFWQRK